MLVWDHHPFSSEIYPPLFLLLHVRILPVAFCTNDPFIPVCGCPSTVDISSHLFRSPPQSLAMVSSPQRGRLLCSHLPLLQPNSSHVLLSNVLAIHPIATKSSKCSRRCIECFYSPFSNRLPRAHTGFSNRLPRAPMAFSCSSQMQF